MMWFDEIEKKRGSSPVVTDDPSHVGSGTLILDGEKSQAVLLSDGTLMGSTNEDGWFRLRLKGPDGRPILLHNALLTSSTQYTGQHGRMYEEHVYPNAVILGSDALLPGYKVPSIAFTMRNLGAFFHYQHVESHHLFRPAKHIVAALKGLRDKKDRSYDLFKPQEVFVVHQFPRVLSFKVDGHRYEVFVGSKQSGLGWKKIDFQTDPIATIHFAEPLGIEEAMDLAWQWKRYFENLALRPIPWTSLTARSGRGRAMRDADFYLPNHDSRSADENGPFQFWLGNIPLNRWSERNALATVMKTWTEREGDRHRLRGAVQSVARNLRRGSSLDDVVALCAGVESLAELRGQPALSSEQSRIIADGAITVAKANGIDIEDARLRGVIGSLQNQSLGQRLKLMFASLEPFINKAQAKTLIAAIMELRQIAAHGLSPAADVMPKASPTVEGFACACALYDLVTCGMPVRSASDQRVGLLGHATRSIGELENIRNRANRLP
ncbi:MULTISPECIES: hypothetical protein [Brevundimonas]|jgi:hypothetical protein|uniref:hypothetical protein n=1 Tax=Brevundimonas TaxID=41275 RepID=UPI0025C686D6|nr:MULTISPECIES: hypothetical protein [unclassified Brevundimonas]